MHDQFRNEKCAVCGMKLFEDEEIVVCPECGTPYHKECWYRAGLCVHSAEHGAFEWKGESQKLKEHFENIETAQNEKKENDPQFEIIHAESYDEYREIMNKRLLEQEKDMGEVDGVTPEEMLKFVGKNGYYYLPVFREFIKHGKIMKMNFAAFLLFPLHCFYRKMNLFGVIGTAIFFLFNELRVIMMNNFGLDEGNNGVGTLIYYASIAAAMAINLFILMFFNYFYFKTMLKKINRIKLQYANESYDSILCRIEAAGKPGVFYSVVFSFCTVLVMLLILQVINNMLGINLYS